MRIDICLTNIYYKANLDQSKLLIFFSFIGLEHTFLLKTYVDIKF